MKLLLTIISCLLFAPSLCADPPEELPAVIGFPGAEVLTENTVRIPFELADHLILLKATINGQYGNLILDTGSEHLVVNKKHFQSSKPRVTVSNGYGVNGALEDIPGQRISEFAFDGFRLPNQIADIIDLSHIEDDKKQRILGVLGKDVLFDFEIYIDFYLQQVTLFRTHRNGDRIDDHLFLDTPNGSVPFSLEGHSIVLNTWINNTPLRMVLDTGSEINFLDTDIPEKALENFRIIQKVRFKGMSKRKAEAFAGKLYRLRLETDHAIGVMRTILADLGQMSGAYGTSIDGVLGYEFIAMRRLLINYKKKALIFVNPPYKKKAP